MLNKECQEELKVTFKETSNDLLTEPGKIDDKFIPNEISYVTLNVLSDYYKLTSLEFATKYQVSKTTYKRRVMMYGDPYMNSPLAKAAK